MRLRICGAVALLGLAVTTVAQERVRIVVDASSKLGNYKPIWPYFGYDEPNYTYARNGTKLIGELAGTQRFPVYIRAHNLLTTGDGTPALKWGSTNAYTEDAAGKPVYDWTIVDRIVDTYRKVGAKPFVEIGFMPKALSIKPDPYQHDWPRTKIAAGWAHPPRDYQKWGELVYQWVRHSIQKYGAEEVNSWYWEVWNEPDIEYWQGTPEEYNKLYDFAADAVKRAAPGARVGGPATTGPERPKAAEFLTQFLQHCDSGRNSATGKIGASLDFITYHAKGAPKLVDGHVEMGIAKHLRDVDAGMKIVTSFPKFASLPIILSESDPEGCAACSARNHPENAYRNGALYPTYTAAVMNGILALADERKANMEGMLTWAFEFEGQPYFDGFRTLATNGVDKPMLNVFRMMGMMHGERVRVQSTGAIPADTMARSGVREQPDVNALAVSGEKEITVLAWNYQDQDVPGPDAPVSLRIARLPLKAKHVTVQHFRLDGEHSNAYTVWKQIGSPQNPTPEQQSRLEQAGQLEKIEEDQRVEVKGGEVQLGFGLPRQAVSLLRLRW